jgi:hypothetical protein
MSDANLKGCLKKSHTINDSVIAELSCTLN